MKEKRTEKVSTAKSNISVQHEKENRTNKILRMLLPHIVAVAIFAFVNMLFFSPMLFDNKIIRQSDIIHYRGMSKELVDFREKTGQEALWTNTMFGGMPAFQISVDYRGNLLQYIDKMMWFGFPHPSELFFIAFLCFYIFLVVLGVNPWLAIGASIAYGLSSYNVFSLEAGHTSKLHALGLWPLVIAGVLLLRQGKYWWGAVFTAVGLSLQIYANHLQITYYLFLLLLVFAIVEVIYAVKEKSYNSLLKAVGIATLCGVFAILSNTSLLWSTYEYLPSTIRGPSELESNKQSTGGLDKDYALDWSYGKMETMTLLIPNFYGGSSNGSLSEDSNFGKLLKKYGVANNQITQYLNNAPLYWGDQPFTSGPVYVGAIVCFLFLFAMMVLKERWKWWLLASCILAVFLAWGRNMMWFTDIFFYYFPGYNRFRTVYMILVTVQFAFPFLGILVLSKILRGEYDKSFLISRLKLSLYITGGLCLLFALLGPSLLEFRGRTDAQLQPELLDAIVADRKALLRTDAIRSLILILLSAGALWAYLVGRLNRNLFIGAMVVLIFIDLIPVAKRYLDKDDFISKSEYDRYFQPTPADQLILKDPTLDFRVYNLTVNPFTDSRTSYFHESIGGYHAAKLRRYQEIIEHQLTKTDTTKQSPYPFNKAVVDMLNGKYIIYKAGEQEQVLPNTEAMDNAWFIREIKMVDNASAEMNALNDLNPAETAVIDKRFSSQLQGLNPSFDSTANITLESYAPNHLVYKSSSTMDNVAVFSEIYYQPGWDAFIDDKPAEHFRCNYILRGMKIPAGQHKIEFKFEPESFYTGEKIAMASSGLVWILLLGVIGYSLYSLNRKKEIKS